MNALIICTWYPEFLREFYERHPEIASQPYDLQHRTLLDTGFGTNDIYSSNLNNLGWNAREIICNADELQGQWAREHEVALCENIHDRRREIVAAQIDSYRPDLLYIFEWCPLGDAFLAAMGKRVPVIAGQIASPLRPERTYQAYDIMFSSWPPIVARLEEEGVRTAPLWLGFDERALTHTSETNLEYDVTFIGGFAPSHPDRIAWLERLLERVPIDVFGYGAERTDPDSPIRRHHRGPVWGWEMFRTLRQSRITLNRHAINDVRGVADSNIANNLRLYEATGVGTCLLTDAKANLDEMFQSGVEVETYADDDECVAKIERLLADDPYRREIAQAGQARTLRDHTFAGRIVELHEILEELVHSAPRRTVSLS